MALLVLENAELRKERDHARNLFDSLEATASPRIEAQAKRIAELKAAGINYDRAIKERDALAAELRAGREGNQHYAGELRTFFEGVRALIGAEEMKDDCLSVLQELGRHTKRPGPASSARGWVLESQDEVRELLRKQREERYPPTPRPDPEVKPPE